MRVLMVGGGGREHALLWKFGRDDPHAEFFCAPGNAGIAEIAECIPLRAGDVMELADFARKNSIDLTIVGPEAPLAEGIVDRFRSANLTIFGPSRAAARIETSKAYAKDLMMRAGVPTAHAERHTDAIDAKRAARNMGAPVVIKASGLAAGKGVVVAGSIDAADCAIDLMLSDRAFGTAGEEILVERYLEGEEMSVFVLTDGEHFLPLLPAQDYKRLLDNDAGPNTGGMGACAPAVASRETITQIGHTVIEPVLRALREQGAPFTGLLYAGLMLTEQGPQVIEFNCRFGDPETETLMPLLDSSLLDLVLAVARGESLRDTPTPAWSPAAAVTTVLAAHGYPDSPRTGDTVELPPQPQNVHLFHCGTRQDPLTGGVVTAGGRVFAVTAVADTLRHAAEISRAYAERIRYDGKQFRRDVGWRQMRPRA